MHEIDNHHSGITDDATVDDQTPLRRKEFEDAAGEKLVEFQIDRTVVVESHSKISTAFRTIHQGLCVFLLEQLIQQPDVIRPDCHLEQFHILDLVTRQQRPAVVHQTQAYQPRIADVIDGVAHQFPSGRKSYVHRQPDADGNQFLGRGGRRYVAGRVGQADGQVAR